MTEKKTDESPGTSMPDPTAMMRKMMTGMGRMGAASPSDAAERPMMAAMPEMMGMFRDMLASIQRTTSMAATATPELAALFEDWLSTLEVEAAAAMREAGATDAATLAAKLDITHESAAYLIGHMLREGKVSVRVSPSEESDR